VIAGVVVLFVSLMCAGGLYVGSRRAEVEIRFDDGPLGVSYKGNKVIAVRDDGQSAAKGVHVGWRFLSIQGTAVPNDEKVAFLPSPRQPSTPCIRASRRCSQLVRAINAM
jgi:hypothetical protein